MLAYVLGRFVVLLEVVDWKGALNLGVWLWIGFPVSTAFGLGHVAKRTMEARRYPRR